MKAHEIELPPELDDLLIEWARHFRDRRLYQRCMSLEGQYNRYAPGARDEAWGDPGPPEAILPPVELPRVLRTHESIQRLPRAYKWAITYRYCYPGLERWRILKFMKKYTGVRFTWGEFEQALEMGRMRVWAALAG